MDLLRASLAGFLIAFAGCASAQTDVQVKAAFLYKFGAFVEWPASAFRSPAAPLAIGVVGADDVADELERVTSGRKVHEHPVTVRRLRRGDPVAGLHVLFVGEGEGGRLREILAGARGQPVLVVTDAPRSSPPPGSMINFVTEDDRMRFDVALAPAEEGRLKISARLLAVARKVISS
jgi:hypothetical protein